MPRHGSLRRDILSAYLASGSRLLSWVIVSAMVYRQSTGAFAMLALVRGTLGILNYASLGILPAMIRALAASTRDAGGKQVAVLPELAPVPAAPASGLHSLDYEGAQVHSSVQRIYGTGTFITLIAAVIATPAIFALVMSAKRLFRITGELGDAEFLIACIGFGIVVRWLSEPAAAVLQTHNQIVRDNVLQFITELVWIVLTYLLLHDHRLGPFWDNLLRPVGGAYLVASGVLLITRVRAAGNAASVSAIDGFDPQLRNALLSTGLIITLAQFADYLYAPTDYILINRLLGPEDLANYAPGVQIDAGLMILVSALASVVLPRAALAHAAGDRDALRAYYVRGTLASGGLLAAAGVLVYFLSPFIFRLWLADPMPGTRAILPLVLVCTVLGGSSAVGRSILLGMGKARPFTIAVLIAGATNVACSYAFVRYFHLGLRGIILGTIVAVVARCALWMPWYVLRQLRSAEGIAGTAGVEAAREAEGMGAAW
jgi:O-antigen/teichoic acid export membrane protein